MKLTTLACSLGIGACLLLPVAAAAQTQTENVNRTVPLPANGSVSLQNFSGRVVITGTTGRDVVIKAVRRADRERLDHIKLDIRTEGSKVVIEANKRDDGWNDRNNNVVDTEFDVEVPAAAPLKVTVFSSDVTVKDVTGSLDINTFNGDIDADIVRAGASPELHAHTFSGDITVRISSDAKANVDMKSFSGDLDTDVPVTMRSSRRGRGRVSGTISGGSSGNGLNFDTFSGNVRIKKS